MLSREGSPQRLVYDVDRFDLPKYSLRNITDGQTGSGKE